MLFAFIPFDGAIGSNVQTQATLLQALLALFFITQLVMGRSLESETEDGFLTQMVLQNTNAFAWFFAKNLILLTQIGFIALPTFLFIAAFSDLSLAFWGAFLPRAILGTLGLAPLGFVLQAACFRSAQQKILLPALFFPLSSPVFLAIAHGTLNDKESSTSLALILAFDVVYIVLSSVLFSELTSEKTST